MPEVSEDIEIEQMVRWLCTHANHFTVITYNGGVSVYSAWMRAGADQSPLKLGDGPTLREALADAVRTVRSPTCPK